MRNTIYINKVDTNMMSDLDYNPNKNYIQAETLHD